MTSGSAHQLITANSLLLLESQHSSELRRACTEAEMVSSDSIGISLAAFYLGRPVPHRQPGIDLAKDLCGLAEIESFPVYLLGGRPGVAGKAATALQKEFPNLMVVGMRDGFFRYEDEPAILEDIGRSNARLILVALGMPKQEIWIAENRHRLSPGLYVGVGGSFDVWANVVKRAPILFRKFGLEWLFRLAQEPFRWKRIAQLPTFVFRVLLSRFATFNPRLFNR